MHTLVLTIDRRASRAADDDLVAATRDELQRSWRGRLASPVARFAGDELQLVPRDADACIAIALALTRSDAWSVGLGIGSARLAQDPAASSGPAFYAARRAIDRAKRAPTRLAVEGDDTLADRAADVEAVLGLLVTIRDRRTREGWEVADLLERHATQRAVAETLGISASAVSARVVAAALRVESAGVATVEGMLTRLAGGEDA